MSDIGSRLDHFLHDAYQRHNRRRQEHLATLGLPVAGRSVLEVGAGIGDHTSFFLDRGCRVTVTDARASNLEAVRRRYDSVGVAQLDLEQAALPAGLEPHDVVYAYGILYHLKNPDQALANLSRLTRGMLLLETCVSFGQALAINPVLEEVSDPTQSASGFGCRPTRGWVFAALQRHFPFAYVTRTQPWHDEFPVDWRAEPPRNATGLYRSVFVGSRQELPLAQLSPSLLDSQSRA